MKVFYINNEEGLAYALRYKGDKRLKYTAQSPLILLHSLVLDSRAQIILEDFEFGACDIIVSSKGGVTLRNCSFNECHVRFDAADNVLVQKCRFKKTMVHSILTQGIVLNMNKMEKSLVEFSTGRNVHLQNSHVLESEVVVCPNSTVNIFNNVLEKSVIILSPQIEVGVHECFFLNSKLVEGDLLDLYLCRNIEILADGSRRPLPYTSRNHDEMYEPEIYQCRILNLDEIMH